MRGLLHIWIKEVTVNPFKYISYGTAVLAALLFHSAAVADTANIADELVVTSETSVSLGYQSFSLRD